MSEHDLQSMCVNWFRLQYSKYSRNIFAVPNGTFFGAGKNAAFAYSRKLKEEGVLNGVADVLLLVPNITYHGLCIEFKVGYNKQSSEQVLFQSAVEKEMYVYVVCKDFNTFQQIVREYLDS